MRPVRVAILTVSDTASHDASYDQSGQVVRDILLGKQCICLASTIVPDDVPAIQAIVKGWCSQGDIDCIITTGGTGFGQRDNTPEAIGSLLDRQAPGLVHLMLSTSLQHTPMAALSRPVAGTLGETVVITLPGSVKAVRENLDALLSSGVLFHAVELNRGGSGKALHDVMANGAGPPFESARSSLLDSHGCGGHHHGNHGPRSRTTSAKDPSAAAHARQRESPFPLIDLEQAISMVMTEVSHLPIVEIEVSPSLVGHVLAEDVNALADIPSTKTTNVDGYALRSTDGPGNYRVLTPRTHALSSLLPDGCIYRINTGAPLPLGADAVLMVEDTHLHATEMDRLGNDIEEKQVTTLAQVESGENVRPQGSDAQRGELVMKRGTVISALGGEIGTLAFVGRQKVCVHKKPIVAILSTGNEIVDILSSPARGGDSWGGIWDTNRPSLQAALQGMGYQVLDLGIVTDERHVLAEALEAGLRSADLIITTGGTSMGVTDLLKPVLEIDLGGTIHFGRVKVKPGKPTTFATVTSLADGADSEIHVGVAPRPRVPVFGLPGNPASALVMFYVFVVPALRKLSGWPEERSRMPCARVQVQDDMLLDPRPEFHRVEIRAGADGLKAYSTGGQRSSRVASLNGANGLVALPARTNGLSKILAGTMVNAVVIGELQSY